METNIVVDCIVRHQGGIVLVERRKEPRGLALPGGHLEGTETLEQAIVREVQEETGLRLSGLRQFGTYSDPNRDPRGRAISTVFIADGRGTLQAGDDAAGVQVVQLPEIDTLQTRLAFDHYKILSDYKTAVANIGGQNG